jgi:molecular chaperone GrpE
MDDIAKEHLLEQFRAYLEEASIKPEAPADNEAEAFSLYAELAGLKNEVKRESRQVKEALDQFKSVFTTLQADNEALSQELEQRRLAEKALHRDTLRPLLLQLLELYDRLEAGIKLAPPQRLPWARLCRGQTRLLESLQEGQQITLRRLNRLLADYQIRSLDVMGKPLDPHNMRVMEVESRPDLASGVVTGELRKGFVWNDELLRPAEVKVNKRGDVS